MKPENLHKIYLEHPVICTDSRNITENSIFWALKGENFDGNNFVEQALKSGASFAVSDNPENKNIKNCIFVDDSLYSLQILANRHRNYLNIPIIGITGTNGKTTTKELIAQVLKEKFNVGFTQGNFNNHIGVPLSILNFDNKTEIGIIEMGANHSGEIEELCNICEPDYGIITNVGNAHLEGFGTFENVLNTKLALYRAVKKRNGLVFYNSTNKILADNVTNNKNIPFGNFEKQEIAGKIIETESLFLSLDIFMQGQTSMRINTKLVGEYNLENIVAAFCIGVNFKIGILEIKEALENYKAVNNRSQIIETQNNTIILDAYNANPTSMKASLTNFFKFKGKNKIIIAGDMLELGKISEQEHFDIINFILKNDFEQTYLVGENFSKATEKISLPENIKNFKTAKLLKEYLNNNKTADKNILLKGSRGIRLEQLTEVL